MYMNNKIQWDQKSTTEVITELKSNIDTGISNEAYQSNLSKFGANSFQSLKKENPILTFLKNFLEPLILILIAIAVLSFAIGDWKEGVVVVSIVALNSAISTFQEIKSKKVINSLKKLSSPQVTIVRNSQVLVVDSSSLVPGDIVHLDAGRFIPADIRLLTTSQLQIDESALTGESVPVFKHSDAIISEGITPLGDQLNMAFMSTFITNGRAVGIVVRTGNETEMGKISEMLNKEGVPKTPLQKKLAKLTLIVSLFAFVMALVMFGVQMINNSWNVSLITSITLAVAIIPECLPIIISVILAISVQRMAKQNAVVKKMPSVETLGSVNVICSDKTGTLTQNKMTVVNVSFDDILMKSENFKDNSLTTNLLLNAMVLCNDSFSDANGQLVGDPTETSLISFALKNKVNEKELQKLFPRVDEIPFDSQRKMMSTLHSNNGKESVYVKGAIDNVLTKCSHVLVNEKIVKLTPDFKKIILENAKSMTTQALRVISFAYKQNKKGEEFEKNLTFIGFVGLIDPPRMEVFESIAVAKNASIFVKMITGDHKDTAFAIAKSLEIASDMSEVVSGSELNDLTDEQLQENVITWKVFARVSPEHKVRIVQALQRRGLVVAMTGDGVNDAPSLKTANIGIAMGITGTDVSKEAAAMVLADDNFSTIVKAVSEGRNIYKKIQKAIAFVLATNFSELLAIFIILLAIGHSALTAVQVLWINLIVESIIAIPMSMDKNDPLVMHNKPRPIKESLFKNNVILILFAALALAGAAVGGFFIGQAAESQEIGNALVFLVMSSAPMLIALVMRFDTIVIFTKKMFSNKPLLIAIVGGFSINVLAIYTPLSVVFDLHFVPWYLFAIGLGLIVAPTIIIEFIKLTLRFHARSKARNRKVILK